MRHLCDTNVPLNSNLNCTKQPNIANPNADTQQTFPILKKLILNRDNILYFDSFVEITIFLYYNIIKIIYHRDEGICGNLL